MVTRDPRLLQPIIGEQRWAAFADAIEYVGTRVGPRKIWNINATASGGGVAEMLQVLLGYCRGAGIDVRWLVLDGDPAFFAVTKRIHNRLHGFAGDGLPLDDAARAAFDATTARNLDDGPEAIAPGDIVLAHDPQTAGLIAPLRERGAIVIWRCHIGRDTPNAQTDDGWAFLAPDIAHAHRVVVSRDAYVPADALRERTVVIPPSIDPFATKNLDMTPEDVRRTLTRIGLFGDVDEPGVTFRAADGTVRPLGRYVDLVVAGGPIPPDARLVVQVSRWDRLKDMAGVMRGFALHTPLPDGVHLALVGPATAGVTDDPEGDEVLNECIAHWRTLPEDMRRRVHLVCLPMDDVDENAHMVNAIQRHATVIVQKSLVEGFGLTVTEAMWKGRPIVASAVGGIQDQIADGRDGLLVGNPMDLTAFGEQLGHLLHDPDRAARLGAAARERAFRAFLPDRHLMQYANLVGPVLD